MKFFLYLICILLLASCAAADKRLYGNPSVSVAIYSNQILHASKLCGVDNNYVNHEDANTFLRHVNTTLNPKYYIENYEEFSTTYKKIDEKYKKQFSAMGEIEKQNYCLYFSQDIELMKKLGIMTTIQRHLDFRRHASPPHEAPEDLKAFGTAAILLLQAVPTAKGVSQSRKGDYIGASKSFETSRLISNSTSGNNANYTQNGCINFSNITTRDKRNIDFSFSNYISIMACDF